MASSVTMQPFRHNMRSSSGMAVISLDLSSTAVWARTRRLAWAQALTRCRGPAPDPGRGNRARSGRRRARPGPRSVQRPPAPSPGSPPRTRSHPAVRGDAVRQLQEGAQPRLVELAEEGDGHEAVGAANDGQHRQHQDVRQGVQLGPVDPRTPGRPGSRPGTQASGGP